MKEGKDINMFENYHLMNEDKDINNKYIMTNLFNCHKEML